MLGLNKIGLNLRIGSKLGITSGIGVLLVAAIMVSQTIGNSQIEEKAANALRNDANALAAVNAKASVRGMQVGLEHFQGKWNPGLPPKNATAAIPCAPASCRSGPSAPAHRAPTSIEISFVFKYL